MARVQCLVTLATLLGAGGIAAAQPGQLPAAAPGPLDPVLAEQVAASLVTRAQDLYDAREIRDAKELAVEAVVTAPQGPSADRARALIHRINEQLGIPEEQLPVTPPPVTPPPVTPPPVTPPPVTPPPVKPPVAPPPVAPPASRDASDDPRERLLVARIHAGSYTALLGATLGASFDDSAATEVPLGLAGGAAGSLLLAPYLDRHLDEAQLRTLGAGATWGGVIGGLMADITTGTGVGQSGTSPRQVLIGASIGATAGIGGGWAIAKDKKLTRGDVALVDTLAGIGTFGGLTLGMLMQPAQSEAYDLNAVIGAAGGVIAGLVAAPKTNTTPRRMLRVATWAAAGGAAPFVLYPLIYSSTSSADERVVGALSTLGLVGGAWFGFYKTRHWDEGKDAAGAPGPSDAPPAAVGRASDGHWELGAPALVPLSPQLDNHQHGAGLSLLAGRF